MCILFMLTHLLLINELRLSFSAFTFFEKNKIRFDHQRSKIDNFVNYLGKIKAD